MLNSRVVQATAVFATLLWHPLVLPAQSRADGWRTPGSSVECSGSVCDVLATVGSRSGDAGGVLTASKEPVTEPVERPEPGISLADYPGVVQAVFQTGDCRVVLAESGVKDVACGGEESQRKQRVRKAPSAEVVAWRAVEELALPSPVIRMSPAEDAFQVVGVPSWLWVESGVWGPVSETAEVPGLSVTATAWPREVVWSLGEGGRVVCEGPGTPYSAVFAAGSASPDCGYTYTRSSVGEPGGTFRVSVALSWDVVWEGGGESGRVPGVVTVDEIDVRVDEIQALVVNSQ